MGAVVDWVLARKQFTLLHRGVCEYLRSQRPCNPIPRNYNT